MFDPHVRVFGLSEWTAWFDRIARKLFGMSGEEFERAYAAGTITDSGPASDLGSVIPLIRRLRASGPS
jgi:hypothetical protein